MSVPAYLANLTQVVISLVSVVTVSITGLTPHVRTQRGSPEFWSQRGLLPLDARAVYRSKTSVTAPRPYVEAPGTIPE